MPGGWTPRTRNRGPRRKHDAEQQARHRQRRALREHLSADDTPRQSTTASAPSDRKRVFILSRSAFAGAQRNGVTAWSGDILSDFETYQAPDPRRPELRAFRHSLLDDRYRRLLHRQSERSGLSRVVRALVSVRHVLPDLPRARNAHHRSERALVLWAGGAVDSDQRSTAALSS